MKDNDFEKHFPTLTREELERIVVNIFQSKEFTDLINVSQSHAAAVWVLFGAIVGDLHLSGATVEHIIREAESACTAAVQARGGRQAIILS